MDPIGKSPVPVPVLVLGKLAMTACWLFFLVRTLGIDAMLYDSAVTRSLGVVLVLAGFLVCVGSCLIFIHPVNFLLCALAVGIHHAIVIKEERFLEERFGEQWLEYKQRVPRYLGWPKATAANRISA
jgi:hypothetical protein